MRKFIFFTFIFILVFCLSAFSAVYWLMNSAPMYEFMVPRLFASMAFPAHVDHFSLQRASLGVDGQYQVKGLETQLSVDGENIFFAFDVFDVSNIITLIRGIADSSVTVSLRNGSVRFEKQSINGLDLRASLEYPEKHVIYSRGTLAADHAVFEALKTTEITALFELTPASMRIYNIEGFFYGGSIIADYLYDFDQSQAFEARLNIAGIDVERLGTDRPDLVSQLKGIANISLRLGGKEGTVELLEAEARFTKNGKISAALLAPLLTYIPQHSIQRKDLERLVELKQMIDLDKSVVQLKNAGADTVSATVQLASSRFNIDINLSIDVNVEGGVLNLLNVMALEK
jgi:hypothetical protein